MGLRKLTVLTLFLAALGGYIYFVELPNGEKKSASEKLLPHQVRGSLHEIDFKGDQGEFGVINTAPQESHEISKPEAEESNSFSEAPFAKWEVKGIKGAKVDSGALGGIVSNLLETKLDSKIEKKDLESDLATYGLNPSELTLTVITDKEKKVVHFGKKNEFLGKRYAQIEGDDSLYLVENALFDAASKKLIDIRNKQPFSFTDLTLKGINFRGPQSNFALTEGEDFSWKFSSPGTFSGSSSAVTEFLRKFRALRASEFIDPPIDGTKRDDATFGFTDPFITLSLSFKDSSKEQPKEFLIGHPQSSDIYYAAEKGSSLYFKLDGAAVEAIAHTGVSDLREKIFVKAVPQWVSEVTFTDSSGKIHLEKKGDLWNVDGKEGDAPFISDLIKEITALKAIGYPEQSTDFGFTSPTLTIEIKEQETTPNGVKDRVSKLVIGKGVDAQNADGTTVKRYYAAVGDLSEPFIIDEPSFKKITPNREALVKVAPSPTSSPS